MTRRFFSGSTLDQAVMMAARHYELDPQDLAYRQIEKRHGFLRTRKAVMIAVDPEQPSLQAATPGAGDIEPAASPEPPAIEPERDLGPRPEAQPEPHAEPRPEAQPEPHAEPRPEAQPEPHAEPQPESHAEPRPEPQPEARPELHLEPHSEPQPEPEMAVGPEPEPVAAPGPEPAGPVESAALAEPTPREHDEEDDQGHEEVEQDEELLDAAERAARTLLRFSGIDAEASARSGPERVNVELEGPDSAVLVVENGTGLLAIQHLLPRMMRGLAGRSSFVRVDSEDFHGKRKERLRALALKEAEAVSRDGTPRTLPPMAPDERRIVHLTVQEIPTVVTESEGGGLHKRVVIRPVAADGGHDDIEARHGF